ncbi:hypothetical protein FLJC2902T_24580 [Flavobacterium limnosediminis JC2902]|uniref:Phosphoglycerate mutase n=1 Tax=Flavobacterium limnosediminis JC2902 TaxID=1341181 RepID=V6SJN4_9FLAO|nr:phosphoglycerate mutase family protein [Flavobacterium limnosediminis]ESU26487.1 hypothetical protein FLJC2902T_24580 [Flavobacterium limnosediminis JC2902]
MSESSQFSKQTNESTVFYFIRHAEKEGNSSNPHLTEIGLKRAENWSRIFSEINFDLIYSTDYVRTIQTVTPVAHKNKKEIETYSFRNINMQQFRKDCIGKKVLIAGHMNTVPTLVNQLINQDIYPDIDEDNFGNLYIVTIVGEFITHQLLKLP